MIKFQLFFGMLFIIANCCEVYNVLINVTFKPDIIKYNNNNNNHNDNNNNNIETVELILS